MSDMHAETAMWIDGLRRRADKAETSMRDCPRDHAETVAARDRLTRLRQGLDESGRDAPPDTDRRSQMEKLADDLDQAISRALVRL